MIGNPKVSVCMVTYNQSRFIRQAVESAVAQQTTFPVEIVIGEDCSTDRTREELAALGSRYPQLIKVHFREQNLGGAQNFLETYNSCRGEFIAILEGDDYWTSPHKLQRQVDAMEANPHWSMCFHAVQVRDDRRPWLNQVFPYWRDQRQLTVESLLKSNFIQTCSVVYRRGLVAKLPDWHAELSIGDWPLHILFALQGEIGYLPQVMGVYRHHANSVWSSKSEAQRAVLTMQTLQSLARNISIEHRSAIESAQLHLVEGLAYIKDTPTFRAGQVIAYPASFALRLLSGWGWWRHSVSANSR